MKNFFLLLTLFILLFPVSSSAAGSAIGTNCDSNDDCASGDCEDSDIAAGNDDFCVCGEPADCEQAYGKEQGETWECTDKDDDESYGLHYCLSNTKGKQSPFTVGQLAKGKKGAEEGAKQMPYPVVPPKIQVSLPTLQPFQTQMVTPGEDISLPWLAEYIIAIYRYAIIIGSALAVLVILIGGILYLTAGGIPNNVKTAQSLIFGSIFGLVLLLCSHLILNTINPNLTKLSALNIETVKEANILEGEFTNIDIPAGSSDAAPAPGGTLANYKQCNKTWSNFNYSGTCSDSGSICKSGCGITSTAMILSFYGKQIIPPDVAKWLLDNNFRQNNSPPAGATCTGVSHQAISAAASHWGLKAKDVSIAEGKQLLVAGYPLIAHVKNKNSCGKTPSTCKFTKCGHYIVVKNVQNGIYGINDPGHKDPNNETATDKELFEDCNFAGFVYIYQ